ncbi:MAG TPA: FapA family protein [Syntrophomonadaceae bacterium]|nr:FapA family protein [Syntrophomonadaceae bacterium]
MESRFFVENGWIFIELGSDIQLIGDFYQLLEVNRIDFDLKNILGTDFDKLKIVKLVPEKDLCRVTVSSDNLNAYVSIVPVFPESLTVEDIFKQLSTRQITTGINHERIETIIKDRQPVQELSIVQGVAPIIGSPQIIINHFNQLDRIEFKPDKDGNIDFKNLDNIINVKQGTVLATRIREIEPEPGFDIFGNIIEPPIPLNVNFDVGKGVIVVNDEAIAYMDGYLEWDDRKRVSVNNAMVINGDVAYATGNLNVEGNILIKGDVLPGFSVKSSKNIDILGSVEDAFIQAGGDINIRGSVLGKKGCVLEAQGDIWAYYAQNSYLKCKGSIMIKRYVFNSRLISNDMINIDSQEGVILGDSNKIVSKNAIYIKSIQQDKSLEIELKGFSVSEYIELLGKVENDIAEKRDQIKEIGDKKVELLACKNENKNNTELFELLTLEQSIKEDLNRANKLKKRLSHIIHRIPQPGIIEIGRSSCLKLTISIGSRSTTASPFIKRVTFISDDESESLVIKE